MTDSPTPSPAPEAHPIPDVPERLIKHTVRYADYRAVNREHLTPMFRQYVAVKDQYPHAIVLYRIGDFFETFFQDAITVARELELVLTSKEAGKEIGRVPLAGIPHHSVERYCALLVEKGYAIAICDQIEEASKAQGPLVQRDITRVITPGTVLEEGMLDARRNNFLAAVAIAGNHWGLAYADISTGEFLATQAADLDQLTQELLRLQPSEVLVPTNAPDLGGLLRPGEKSDYLPDCLPLSFCYTLRPQLPFTHPEARQRLLERFRLRSLEGLGCENLPLAVRAAGGLLQYLEDTQKDAQILLHPVTTYALTDYLVIDPQTRRNLELTQTARDGTFHGSLLWAMDRTVTAMGGRALRRWLLQPLLDEKAIGDRQTTIHELITAGSLRQALQQLLRQIYDLERLVGRVGSGTANARDLMALAESFIKLPDLAHLVGTAQSPYLKALQTVPPHLEQMGNHIQAYLVENPPLTLTDGNLIRDGVHAELDAMRQQIADDQQWIADLEATERDRTGIANLRVKFNKVFGYYISVSKAKLSQVPDDYIRKQTLTNEERFITIELKDRESRVLGAKERIDQQEYDIFVELRQQVGEHAEAIRRVAQAIAAVDVLAGLAELAVYQGYCCPQIISGRTIQITEGRHPVVEQSLPSGFFVPNSTQMGQATAAIPDLIVLTGPNASGKSCYLRQVGLIQLMAQMGSFVPAQAAALSICDRIFTRVGAVDDLATGQSTFMVEMNETANILNHATARSLVLLDEIGRGTATFDGLSIAWAVAEYLARDIQARTIFATHYHELNELATLLPNVANYQVVVKEMPDQIIFLHQVRPGGADRSYGIEAGRLAGLPAPVIDRAKEVMAQIEQHSFIAVGLRGGQVHPASESKPRRRSRVSEESTAGQLDIFGVG
ncbi:MAG: DNA mismatch repair protein MutS [Synechococcales bacterium]|nr:DNA mismatch repair protein MutS [Synechococcales bacterium]